MARASTWLAEIGAHDGSGEITLRYSSGGYVSRPTDAPANTEYGARISRIGSFEMHIASSGRTMGEASMSPGEIVLNNRDGALNALMGYGYSSRTVTLKRLASPHAALSTAETVLVAKAESMEGADGLLTLRFYDRRRDIDKPIQGNFYGGTVIGTSASIDGTADLKNKPKPLCFGKCYSVPGVLANPFDQFIQVHDGAVASITPYDGGIAIVNDGDLGSLALLRTTVGNPVHAHTRLAEGVWRAHGRLGFVWTADVLEGTTSANRRAGATALRILAKLGVTGSDNIDTASFTALDALCTQEVGIYIDSEQSGATVLRELLASVGAFIVPNALGKFTVGRFGAPGTSVLTLVDPEIIGDGLSYIANPDTDGNIPTPRIRLRHSRRWHVHTDDDLASCVTSGDPARASTLKQEWLEEIAEDATVLTKHPLARELLIETYLTSSADAEAEAARQLTLHGTERKVIRVAAPSDDAEAAVLAATVTVRSEHLDLSAGQDFVVIGREADYQAETTILTLWG